MNSRAFQWTFLVIVVLGFAGVGLALQRQSDALGSLATTVSQHAETLAQLKTPPTPPPTSPMPPVPQHQTQDIAFFSAVTDVTFVHRCVEGQSTTRRTDWNGQTYSFCLGRNQLLVRDHGTESILADEVITKPQEAPILIRVMPAGNTAANVLVSYAPEPCTTVNDCGAGMEDEKSPAFFRYVYNLSTHAGHRLKPTQVQGTLGEGIWNASGTRAVYYPATCGGAGCEPQSLIGYDLTTEAVTTALVPDTAISPPEGTTSSDLSQFADWSTIEWKTDREFTATILHKGHPAKTVSGRF